MRSKKVSTLVLVSSLIVGFNMQADSAFAASSFGCLAFGTGVGDYLFDRGTNKTTFIDDCDVTDIGKVEGRAGTAGTSGDYEVGIGLNGAQADLTDQLQLDWQDEVVYNWTLDWDSINNIATFSVGGESINYDFDLSASPTLSLDKFNAFGLQARADDPSGFVAENTEISVAVDTITFNPNPETGGTPVTDNFTTVGLSATSSLSSPNIVEQFYTINAGATDLNSINSEITSMSGTFSLDIPNTGFNPQDSNARSRVGFQVLLFDPPVNASSTVPEPTSVLGLIALGFFGVTKINRK